MSVTYYLPSEAGWQSSGASTAYFMRMKVVRSYDVASNKSSYTVSLQAKGSANVYGGTYRILSDGTISGGGSTLYTFVHPDADHAHQVSVGSSGTWHDVTSVYNPSSWTFTVQHADNGSSTVDFGIDLRLYGYIAGGARYGDFYGRTASLTVTEARASSIVSCPASVATQGTLALSMNRASTAFYHKATVTDSQGRALYSSGAFASALNIPVARTWFNNYPSVTSFTAKLSIQTYTNSACTTAVGSPVTANVTISADSGMVPALASGFASAAPYGNPSGFSGYIQGKSRVRVTLSAAKVMQASGASLASYKVVCQSYTGTGTGTVFDTNVLSGTAAVTITVTVTDSRGRTAGTSLSVTPLAYAAPTLSAVSVFRANSGGTANDEGTYISAKATAACSGLNGQNSVTLSCRWRPVGGAFGTAVTLKSGVVSVLGGSLDPDKSYEVYLTATDALGTAVTTSVTLATRAWAMKFRPTGKGVAFGKAPEHDKALELPGDWTIYRGAQPLTGLNMLDNARWDSSVSVVNQRGQNSYTFSTSRTYGIDRWFGLNGTLAGTDGYWSFRSVRTAVYKRLTQTVEGTLKAGQSYTASVLAKVNTLSGNCVLRPHTSLGPVPGAAQTALRATSDYELFAVTFTPASNLSEAGVEILCQNTTSDYLEADILAWKLEHGSGQTLAHQEGSRWVLNDPPLDPALEELKCKRYFHREINDSASDLALTTAVPTGTGSATFVFRLPVAMRAKPDISVSSPGKILYTQGSFGNAVSATAASRNGVIGKDLVGIQISGSFQTNTAYNILLGAGGYIDFNAEL